MPNLDTYPQLIAHLTGDYVLQSHYLATHKVRRQADPPNAAILPAAIHAALYTTAFLPVTRSWRALTLIGTTHFIIDHFRLAIPLNAAKNELLSPNTLASDPHQPPIGSGIDTALTILTDNTVHLLINYLAIRHLPRKKFPHVP